MIISLHKKCDDDDDDTSNGHFLGREQNQPKGYIFRGKFRKLNLHPCSGGPGGCQSGT